MRARAAYLGGLLCMAATLPLLSQRDYRCVINRQERDLAMGKIQDILKERADNGPTIDVEGRKQRWIAALDGLFTRIDAWLAPAMHDGNIKCTYNGQQPVVEQLTGEYLVPSRTYVVGGKQIIRMMPIGTYLVGQAGRVDVTGPRATVRLVLDTDMRHWSRVGDTPYDRIPFDEDEFGNILGDVLRE